MITKLPRGIRNNNPGNIRWGDPWQGLVPVEQRVDKDFCQFNHSTYGIRAICRILISYQDKYKLKSVREIISRWAPPIENDTTAYVNIVAQNMGVKPDATLDVYDYSIMKSLVEFIIKHENGKGPLKSANSWYSDDIITKGLLLAGIEPKRKAIPVNTETVLASTVGAASLTDLVQILPTITQDAPPDDVSRVIIALIIATFAIIIVVSQIKKRKDNLV